MLNLHWSSYKVWTKYIYGAVQILCYHLGGGGQGGKAK